MEKEEREETEERGEREETEREPERQRGIVVGSLVICLGCQGFICC